MIRGEVSDIAPDRMAATSSWTEAMPRSVGSGGSEIPGSVRAPSGRSAAAMMIGTPRIVAWRAVASIVMPPDATSCAAFVSTLV